MHRLQLLALLLLATPAAAQGPIDFSRLRPATDSFVVLVQGQPVGYELITLEKVEGRRLAGGLAAEGPDDGPHILLFPEIQFDEARFLARVKATVERIGWYRNALRKQGRRAEDHEICCVYHAHFLDRDDDERLRRMVHQPMSEYAAAGLEAIGMRLLADEILVTALAVAHQCREIRLRAGGHEERGFEAE